MAKLSARRWLTRIIILCFLLILLCLVGHFLADVTGFSVDRFVTLDLHGNFIPQGPISLITVFVTAVIFLLVPTQLLYWSKPPTPPPPICPL